MNRFVPMLSMIVTLFCSGLAAADPDYQPYAPAPAAEQVSAPLFVVVAYSLIWLVLLGFVVSVWLRQRSIGLELEQLRRQLDQGGQ